MMSSTWRSYRCYQCKSLKWKIWTCFVLTLVPKFYKMYFSMSFSSQSKAPTSLLSFLSDPWSPPQISYPSKTRFIFHLQGYQSTASQCHLQLACLCACSVAQLCPTFYDPMNCNPPGSSVHRILQPEILEWLSMPSSRGSSWSRDQTGVSCITSRFSAMEPTGRSPPTYMTIQIFPLTLGVVFSLITLISSVFSNDFISFHWETGWTLTKSE